MPLQAPSRFAAASVPAGGDSCNSRLSTEVSDLQRGLKASAASIAVNICLALAKILAGVFGNASALVADGIETAADVVSSLVLWGGLKVAGLRLPADENHSYRHGKAEALAAPVVSVALLGAAVFIGIDSVQESSSLPPYVSLSRSHRWRSRTVRMTSITSAGGTTVFNTICTGLGKPMPAAMKPPTAT